MPPTVLAVPSYRELPSPLVERRDRAFYQFDIEGLACVDILLHEG